MEQCESQKMMTQNFKGEKCIQNRLGTNKYKRFNVYSDHLQLSHPNPSSNTLHFEKYFVLSGCYRQCETPELKISNNISIK